MSQGLKCKLAVALGASAMASAAAAAVPSASLATFRGRVGEIVWSFHQQSDATKPPDYEVQRYSDGNYAGTIVSCLDWWAGGTAGYCPDWQDASFSPNGRRLLWVITTQRHHQVIVKTTPDGGGPRPTIHHDNENDTQPAYAPDGRRIVYVRQLDGQSRTRIVTSDLAGNNVRVLTPRMFGYNPEWSPRGNEIVFAHNKTIWAVRPNGRNLRPIIPNGSFPNFAPDGKTLLYTGVDTTNVFTSRPDGTHRRQVNIECANCADRGATWAVFSPDGKQIAFTTPNADGHLALYVVAAGGGVAHQIGDINNGGRPAATTGLSWQSR